MTDDLPLAAEFPPTTQAQWRKLVEAALKGAGFDKRLVSQTYDGLRIEPLYARAAGAKPVAGRPARPWQYFFSGSTIPIRPPPTRRHLRISKTAQPG